MAITTRLSFAWSAFSLTAGLSVFLSCPCLQPPKPGASSFHETQGEDTAGEAARVLIEDVHDAIFDLVELIKTFQSKNKLSKLFLSTLFKRRQEELDAVVDRAITRLQVSGVLFSAQFRTRFSVLLACERHACVVFVPQFRTNGVPATEPQRGN